MGAATSIILAAILVHGEVGAFTAKRFDESISEGTKAGQKVFVLDIDSPGGSVDVAAHITSTMTKLQSKGIRFICFGNGQVASAAFLIYLGCNERLSYTNSHYMHHEMSLGGYQKASEWFLSAVDAINEQDQINAWVVERLGLKSFEPLKERYEKETDYSAEELKKIAPNVHTICVLDCMKKLVNIIEQ